MAARVSKSWIEQRIKAFEAEMSREGDALALYFQAILRVMKDDGIDSVERSWFLASLGDLKGELQEVMQELG